MQLKEVILSLIIIEVATEGFVRALQCYVCEDCNEYEDFKELHICGEIPNETLMKPTTGVNSVTKTSTKKPLIESSSSSKPSERPSIDDYLYEDSDEKHDVVSSQNSNKGKTTKATTTTSTTTTINTTQSPTNGEGNTSTKTSNSLTEKSIVEQPRTTPPLVTNSQLEIIKESNYDGKRTNTIPAVTTTRPKPAIATDYDDYFEYEDPLKMDERSVKSLLKIDEPVCYMIKYHANNTIFTNRGCTASINGNKYLTCQSLYNGAPMESCRVCSANGCNKFLDDGGDEENHGILLNAAGDVNYVGVVMSIFCFIFSKALM